MGVSPSLGRSGTPSDGDASGRETAGGRRDPSTSQCPHAGSVRGPELLRTVAGALRYRFFLMAGVFPYLLGAAVAAGAVDINWPILAAGLAGVLSVGVGIEGMNEYFDSRIGGDRVFASTQRTKVRWHLPVGLAGFGLALAIGVYLTFQRGLPVLCFAAVGAAAALSYLLPPVYLSYRGFGETVIALSYGPGLALGGFFLQAGRLSWGCAFASLLPAALLFALALANEIPDFYGDRLVGKRNIIVRLGRKRSAQLYGLVTALSFVLLAAGLLTGRFPALLALGFALVPLAWQNVRVALRHYDSPAGFLPVIWGSILLYALINILAIAGYGLQ